MSARRAAIAARALLVLLAACAAPAFAIDPAPPFADPVLEQRYDRITHELRCLQCTGENIADTSAMFAQDLRRQVREMISTGRSDGEIRDYMVDRYGEVILLRPKWSARTALLWLLPALLLVGGVVVGRRIVKQRGELLASDDEPVPPR